MFPVISERQTLSLTIIPAADDCFEQSSEVIGFHKFRKFLNFLRWQPNSYVQNNRNRVFSKFQNKIVYKIRIILIVILD